MTDKLIPEGFRKLDVADDFVGLIGPLWFKAEGERLRVGLPLEQRHGNPMGWAHGGLLVTVADMVMGAGSGTPPASAASDDRSARVRAWRQTGPVLEGSRSPDRQFRPAAATWSAAADRPGGLWRLQVA
jgi:acyl-coenzyme A thioesterase PaaI-like protein